MEVAVLSAVFQTLMDGVDSLPHLDRDFTIAIIKSSTQKPNVREHGCCYA